MVKKVAVINDMSGLGKCSLTAAIPVLSVMGVQACPLPTAVLSNQTDYDSYYSIDCTSHMDAYINQWEQMNLTFDGIYTGYLGSELQIEKILHFIDHFKMKDTLLLVDPVMGDHGKTYDVFTDAFGEQMKQLICRADIITPNLTEFCLLTDTDYSELIACADSDNYLQAIAIIARPLLKLGIKAIIITGILYQAPGDTCKRYYNLMIEPEQTAVVSSEIHGESYSGTGDLLTSVVCAGVVRGKTAGESLKLATRFLEAALIDTQKEHVPRNDGINFEPYLKMLL